MPNTWSKAVNVYPASLWWFFFSSARREGCWWKVHRCAVCPESSKGVLGESLYAVSEEDVTQEHSINDAIELGKVCLILIYTDTMLTCSLLPWCATYSECMLVNRNSVKLNLVERGLKSKFGGKPVIFFSWGSLYITRFNVYQPHVFFLEIKTPASNV